MSLVSACHSEMTAHLSIIDFNFYVFCRDFFARVVPGKAAGAAPPVERPFAKKKITFKKPLPTLFLVCF